MVIFYGNVEQNVLFEQRRTLVLLYDKIDDFMCVMNSWKFSKWNNYLNFKLLAIHKSFGGGGGSQKFPHILLPYYQSSSRFENLSLEVN